MHTQRAPQPIAANFRPASSLSSKATRQRARLCRSRSGYSIAALLLLTAAVAVCMGLAASTYRQIGAVDRNVALVNVSAGLIGCGILGACLGASYRKRARGLLVGTLIGGSVGALAGLMSAAPLKAPIALGGSLLLLVVGLGLWMTGRETTESRSPGNSHH